MKATIQSIATLLLIAGLMILTGCTESSTPENTNTEAAASETTIELSEEEMELLETANDTTVLDADPVTSENYEEALRELEEAVEEQ